MGKYYFTDDGSWTSIEPDEVDFTAYPDEHFEDAFSWVADWRTREWAEFLAKQPHLYNPDGDTLADCLVCDKLFKEFRKN